MANHYGLNMINQKVMFPRDDNFSDDELAFLPYFIYFFTLNVSNFVYHSRKFYSSTLLVEYEVKNEVTFGH